MSKVPEIIRVFTDGSKSNDNVGYGVLIADYNSIIHQICGRLSSYVSYEAEAEANKAALTYIKPQVQIYNQILLFSDSKSVIESLKN